MRSSEPRPPDPFVPLAGGPAPAPAFRPLGTAPDGPDDAASAVEEPPPPDARVEEAFRAGLEPGRAEAAARLEPVGRELAAAIDAVGRFHATVRARVEREVLALAVALARRIVREALEERPERWLGMIAAAVARLADRERLVLRVPPALAAWLRDAGPALRAAAEGVRDLEVVEDAGLPAGGCVVESRCGDVDLGVDVQCAAAAEALGCRPDAEV
jgi:flagellar assembly protein FliH